MHQQRSRVLGSPAAANKLVCRLVVRIVSRGESANLHGRFTVRLHPHMRWTTLFQPNS